MQQGNLQLQLSQILKLTCMTKCQYMQKVGKSSSWQWKMETKYSEAMVQLKILFLLVHSQAGLTKADRKTHQTHIQWMMTVVFSTSIIAFF